MKKTCIGIVVLVALLCSLAFPGTVLGAPDTAIPESGSSPEEVEASVTIEGPEIVEEGSTITITIVGKGQGVNGKIQTEGLEFVRVSANLSSKRGFILLPNDGISAVVYTYAVTAKAQETVKMELTKTYAASGTAAVPIPGDTWSAVVSEEAQGLDCLSIAGPEAVRPGEKIEVSVTNSVDRSFGRIRTEGLEFLSVDKDFATQDTYLSSTEASPATYTYRVTAAAGETVRMEVGDVVGISEDGTMMTGKDVLWMAAAENTSGEETRWTHVAGPQIVTAGSGVDVHLFGSGSDLALDVTAENLSPLSETAGRFVMPEGEMYQKVTNAYEVTGKPEEMAAVSLTGASGEDASALQTAWSGRITAETDDMFVIQAPQKASKGDEIAIAIFGNGEQIAANVETTGLEFLSTNSKIASEDRLVSFRGREHMTLYTYKVMSQPGEIVSFRLKDIRAIVDGRMVAGRDYVYERTVEPREFVRCTVNGSVSEDCLIDVAVTGKGSDIRGAVHTKGLAFIAASGEGCTADSLELTQEMEDLLQTVTYTYLVTAEPGEEIEFSLSDVSGTFNGEQMPGTDCTLKETVTPVNVHLSNTGGVLRTGDRIEVSISGGGPNIRGTIRAAGLKFVETKGAGCSESEFQLPESPDRQIVTYVYEVEAEKGETVTVELEDVTSTTADGRVPVKTGKSKWSGQIKWAPNEQQACAGLRGPQTVVAGDKVEVEISALPGLKVSGRVNASYGLRLLSAGQEDMADGSGELSFMVSDGKGPLVCTYEVTAPVGERVSLSLEDVVGYTAEGERVPGSVQTWSAVVSDAENVAPQPSEPVKPDDPSENLPTDPPTDTPSPAPGDAFSISGAEGDRIVGGITMEKGQEATKVEDLVTGFQHDTGYTVRVLENGEEQDGERPAVTGQVVELLDDAGNVVDSGTVVIPGDVLGTGRMDISQVVRMATAITGEKPLEGAYLKAAKWGEEGRVSIADMVRQARLLLS